MTPVMLLLPVLVGYGLSDGLGYQGLRGPLWSSEEGETEDGPSGRSHERQRDRGK